MAAPYKYIYLSASNGSNAKRYRVLFDNYSIVHSKSQTVRRAATGAYDIAEGEVKDTHNYLIRVWETELDSNYGDYADLLALYFLNDPGGTPSNVLKFRDHMTEPGNEQNVMMIGDFVKQPLTIMIAGSDASFIVKLQLAVL